MILKDEVGIITITIKRKDKKSAGGGGGAIYIIYNMYINTAPSHKMNTS